MRKARYRNQSSSMHCTLRYLQLVFLSITASARLGGCGWRAFRDAFGEPVREGRGPPLCALPALPALPSLAAGLHHHHEHGPAAVGCQRGEVYPSNCPWPHQSLNSTLYCSSSRSHIFVSLSLYIFLTITYFSLPDLLLCRQHTCQCRSQAQWHPVCDCGNRCSECLHDNSCCRYTLLNIWKSLWVKHLKREWGLLFDHISRKESLLTRKLLLQVFIVEASGRRLLLLCGFGICCAACVLLTVALNLQVE